MLAVEISNFIWVLEPFIDSNEKEQVLLYQSEFGLYKLGFSQLWNASWPNYDKFIKLDIDLSRFKEWSLMLGNERLREEILWTSCGVSSGEA